MKITIKKAARLKPLPDSSSLGFGTLFTDHMFNMDYIPEKGWSQSQDRALRANYYGSIDHGTSLWSGGL